MVRQATILDREEITNLVIGFLSRTFPHSRMNEQRLASSIVVCILEHAVFVSEQKGMIVGAIALHVAPIFWSSDLAATELFWYVAPEYRGTPDSKLLYFNAQAWARARGCKEMIMGAPEGAHPGVSKFYESVGYKKLQIHYSKRLDE